MRNVFESLCNPCLVNKGLHSHLHSGVCCSLWVSPGQRQLNCRVEVGNTGSGHTLGGIAAAGQGLACPGACLPLASPLLPHLQCALHLHSLHFVQALLSKTGFMLPSLLLLQGELATCTGLHCLPLLGMVAARDWEVWLVGMLVCLADTRTIMHMWW